MSITIVDQLEKVWSNDRDSDLMVVGLLLASKHVSSVFDSVKCVVFLRTDIYELLQFQDRDKFRGDEMHIDWKSDLLIDLVFTREKASLGIEISQEDLWNRIFSPHINSEPISEFILQRTLMRPRDIIQLCNACRDAAQKNGHSVIEESDVKEAVNLYSNWKLSDLINEYRVNHPFLSDLFVLFSNSSFLISRRTLDRKLTTIREALMARYREFSNAFSLDGVLSVLYSIGFLGVIRNGVATYVYNDPNTIERNETQLLIHPCFREALKSVSSIDVVPYEPSAAVEAIASRRSSRRAASQLTRGGHSFQLGKHISDLCERITFALAKSNIPAEVQVELRHNLFVVREDANRIEYYNDPFDDPLAYEVSQKMLRFFSQWRDKLEMSTLLEDKKNSDLRFILNNAVDDLERGFLYGGFTETPA